MVKQLILILAICCNLLATGPCAVSHWSLDDGSGTAPVDSSPYAHNGAFGGTSPTWASGVNCKFAGCLQFGGAGYFTVASSAQYQAMTVGSISAWIYPTAGDSTYRVYWSETNGTGTNQWAALGISSSNKAYYLMGDGSSRVLYMNGNTTITLNAWYHIVVVIGVNSNAMYVNNVAQTLTYTNGSSSTQAFLSKLTGTTTMYFGVQRSSGSNANYLTGYLDSIQIYDNALSSGQVADIYNNGGTANLCLAQTSYGATVGTTATITPVFFGGSGAPTCSDSNCNPSTGVWSYKPSWGEGGTAKTLTFTYSGVTQSVPVVMCRDYSAMVSYSGNPVIPKNAGSWNAYAADSPYMRESMKIGSTYYTLTQGNPTGAANWTNFGVYTSTDRLHWTNYAGNPVLSASPGQWDDHYLGHVGGSVVPCATAVGHTWCAYYSAANAGGTEAIGMAYGEDFLAWTKHPSNPLITPNVGIPTAIWIGNTLHIYAADRPQTVNTVSHYTTTDGTTMTYVGKALPLNSWDWDALSRNVNDPWVVRNPYGYYEMIYTSFFTAGTGNPPNTLQTIGQAVSPDGGATFIRCPQYVQRGSGSGFDAAYPGDAGIMFDTWPDVRYFYAGVDSIGGVAQGAIKFVYGPKHAATVATF